MAKIDIGFVLPTGDTYLKEAEERGHIEVAERLIAKYKLQERFNNSKWHDPVDFLVFDQGALKIGDRYGRRCVVYYPNMLSRKVYDAVLEYKTKNYTEITVFPPDEIDHKYFHC